MQATPPHKEVDSMLDKCLLWYKQQKECRPSSLLLLKEIRDLAVAKRNSSLKQTKLTSFFFLDHTLSDILFQSFKPFVVLFLQPTCSLIIISNIFTYHNVFTPISAI